MVAKLTVFLCMLLFTAAMAKKNPCKGKKDGALVAKGKCSAAYYQCWEGKPVSPNPKCASPLVFNPKAKPQGCSYAGAIGTTCNCEAYFSGDDLTACNVCKGKKKEGANFPMPGNSRAYAQCTTQKSFPLYCNDGLRWCQAAQNCLTTCN